MKIGNRTEQNDNSFSAVRTQHEDQKSAFQHIEHISALDNTCVFTPSPAPSKRYPCFTQDCKDESLPFISKEEVVTYKDAESGGLCMKP
jgi:hypothetical protein